MANPEFSPAEIKTAQENLSLASRPTEVAELLNKPPLNIIPLSQVFPHFPAWLDDQVGHLLMVRSRGIQEVNAYEALRGSTDTTDGTLAPPRITPSFQPEDIAPERVNAYEASREDLENIDGTLAPQRRIPTFQTDDTTPLDPASTLLFNQILNGINNS